MVAHAEATQAAAGEVMSPRRRSLVGRARGLRSARLVEIPAAFWSSPRSSSCLPASWRATWLQQPLIWSDELASILFLWLAMLGAVVAFRRAEHMRMTAIVGRRQDPRCARILDAVATCAALAFLLLIAWPAYEYAYEESFITTPALQIPNSWRAAALPVGICLMALFALLRLVRVRRCRASCSARCFRWRC